MKLRIDVKRGRDAKPLDRESSKNSRRVARSLPFAFASFASNTALGAAELDVATGLSVSNLHPTSRAGSNFSSRTCTASDRANSVGTENFRVGTRLQISCKRGNRTRSSIVSVSASRTRSSCGARWSSFSGSSDHTVCTRWTFRSDGIYTLNHFVASALIGTVHDTLDISIIVAKPKLGSIALRLKLAMLWR